MFNRALGFVLVCLLAASSAFAHSAGVEAQLQARLVVLQADGKESYRAADTAGPGAVVDYQVTYSNRTGAPVAHVLATLPIPAGAMVYLPSSAKPVQVLTSIDGTTFAPTPLRRTVVNAQGASVTQIVPVSEYRFLRWDLGTLAAGASSIVSARMKVIDADTAASVSTTTNNTDSAVSGARK
ncbi:MAG: hypothetical protein JWM78_276 [Verrucomicrobiaceae bacterium]|nr:hypothetical protein [Verrucomicrobiaceae bacterium]